MCAGVSFYNNSQVTNDTWGWAPFYRLIYYVCIFFEEESVQLLLLLIKLFIFLLLNFKNYLFVLESPLADVRCANISSQYMDCIFILLIVSFAEQKF